MDTPDVPKPEKQELEGNKPEEILRVFTNRLSEEVKEELIGTRAGMRLELFPKPIKKEIYTEDYSEKDINKETEKKDNKESIVKLMSGEYIALRKHLEELRKCQTTFYWSSIGAIGVMLTVAARINAEQKIEDIALPLFISSLIALLVVCPIWCVWFEKASSVTRLTSYLRVLEDIITGRSKTQYKYLGWENSYYIYRRSAIAYEQYLRKRKRKFRQLRTGLISFFKSLAFMKNFEPTYQYNILTWCSYGFISSACVILASSSWFFVKTDNIPEWINCVMILTGLAVLVIWFFTIIYTAHVLLDLSHKNTRSIASREKLWRYLLDKRMFDSENQHYLIKNAKDTYQQRFLNHLKSLEAGSPTETQLTHLKSLETSSQAETQLIEFFERRNVD